MSHVMHMDSHQGPVLVTGGAGFIGTNIASRLARQGRKVLVFDNLSRPGVERNAEWLCREHGSRIQIERGDVRDDTAMRRVARDASLVLHLAAQVAVTTSMDDPRGDFQTNVLGTINVLEAVRQAGRGAPVLFTSTNKVYGCLHDLPLHAHDRRYTPVDRALRQDGIGESQPLDFHTPYGCSKGAADQYVLDYARTYRQPTVVFRMSCIYGPHQCGTEDQGWVAHFLIRALEGQPVTLYGDGRQVRDLLFVDDLMDAMLAAEANINTLSGRAFNMGGGPRRAVSLLDVVDHIARLQEEKPDLRFADWRPGDQRYYVSDTRAFEAATSWQARVDVPDGLGRLHRWLQEHRVPAAAVEVTR